MTVLSQLAPLPSYDAYTLRRSLRKLGISVNDHTELKLSNEKNRELTGYMSRFTLPLIREVHGENAMDIKQFEDLVHLFNDPAVKKALARLKKMAENSKSKSRKFPGSSRITAIFSSRWLTTIIVSTD